MAISFEDNEVPLHPAIRLEGVSSDPDNPTRVRRGIDVFAYRNQDGTYVISGNGKTTIADNRESALRKAEEYIDQALTNPRSLNGSRDSLDLLEMEEVDPSPLVDPIEKEYVGLLQRRFEERV